MASFFVTREPDSFSEVLINHGQEVVNAPLIETRPAKDLSELDRAIDNSDYYDGLFVTSAVAAKIFLKRLGERKFHGKIYALGERSTFSFGTAGYDVVPGNLSGTAEELVNSFGPDEFIGKRFLYLRGNLSLRTIPDILGKVAQIDEVVVYTTSERKLAPAAQKELVKKLSAADWICFFSPSGVTSFIKSFGSDMPEVLRIAAIGPTTANQAVEAGWKVDFIAQSPNGFAGELIIFLMRETYFG